MDEIRIERGVTIEQLQARDLLAWPIWEKEASTFPWRYDSAETCYFLTGDVTVTPAGGSPVRMGKGDLVTFPAGMSCIWEIKEPVRKHYSFD